MGSGRVVTLTDGGFHILVPEQQTNTQAGSEPEEENHIVWSRCDYVLPLEVWVSK